MANEIYFKEGHLEDFLNRSGISTNSLYFTQEGYLYKGDKLMSPLKIFNTIYDLEFLKSTKKEDSEDSTIKQIISSDDANIVDVRNSFSSLKNFDGNHLSKNNPLYLITNIKSNVNIGRNIIVLLSDFIFNDSITIKAGLYYIDANYNKTSVLLLPLMDIYNISSGSQTGINLIDHNEA